MCLMNVLLMIYRVGGSLLSSISTMSFLKLIVLNTSKSPPIIGCILKKNNAHNSGFFVQPFLSLTSGEYDYYSEELNFNAANNSSDYGVNDFFGLAGGAFIGRKWVNQKRYTFEIHAGVGRYFVLESDNNAYRDGTAYPRINFSIGRRF